MNCFSLQAKDPKTGVDLPIIRYFDYSLREAKAKYRKANNLKGVRGVRFFINFRLEELKHSQP